MSQYMRIIVMCWWLWLCSLAQDFRKKRFYIYIIAVGLKPTETEVWREIVWKVCIQSQPTTEYVAVNHNCVYCWPEFSVKKNLCHVSISIIDMGPAPCDKKNSRHYSIFWSGGIKRTTQVLKKVTLYFCSFLFEATNYYYCIGRQNWDTFSDVS